MIDKTALEQVINEALEGTKMFLVTLKVSKDNVIDVALDSDEDITIDDCVAVNDAVLAAFDRDEGEDYELTVGSYGITSPLLMPRQYRKNIGYEVEVLTGDGRKLKGVLTDADDEGFTLTMTVKRKLEGKKRPEMVEEQEHFNYSDINQTKNIINI
ncbi:MAG: ribosome assembly cofactor RimP [Muribaculaceae bacterium]|nr:ribosome assembly cofactor RimP [Muribaculaceae bacterium]